MLKIFKYKKQRKYKGHSFICLHCSYGTKYPSLYVSRKKVDGYNCDGICKKCYKEMK